MPPTTSPNQARTSRRIALSLACVLLAAVFALEIPFIRGGVPSQPGLALCSPLGSIAVLLLLVYQRADALEARRWLGIAVTLLVAYMTFAVVVALRVPGGWRSLPEADGSLVTVVLAALGLVVLVLRTRRAKPLDDPNRTLIQTWQARFR